MASFSAGTTFTDGVANDVTAAKLAALVNAATPTSGLIQDRTAETTIDVNDTLLVGDASDSNNLKRMTVANFAGTLPTATITSGTITNLASTTGTIATLNSTTGTIATGVIPNLTSSTATFGTTTSTAATITSGTITNLASTTGTIATLNSTTGTITGFRSTTGTVATLNSTTGTIATLNSTTGTIATLNSTTGTIAGLSSTNGTIATLNSTTGTIAGLSSTNGTIANLNSTTGTVATLNSTTGTITTGVIPTLTSITKITSGTGTAAVPAIVPTGDTNTGIFFPAADTIAFSDGGAERLRIASAGQIGIGGANYGTTGQVLTSAGTGAAPSWQTAAGITSGTAVASTSGTAIDFTGIPSTVKRITVMFDGVSTNGASIILVQIGDSGGIENTSYVGVGGAIMSVAGSNTAAVNFTTGFGIINDQTSASIYNGIFTLALLSSSSWVATSSIYQSNRVGIAAGSKTLSATLDRIRITTVNGTDTFDAGSINIMYEG